MTRLSDEDRRAAREARDEFKRRLLNEQSGVFIREDADVDKTFTYMIDGKYALTHDDLLCPNCDTLCHPQDAAVPGLPLDKHRPVQHLRHPRMAGIVSDFLPSGSLRLSDAQKPGVLYRTLPCGCEEEHVREAGMLYLHYLPTCWRHAPSPPFVIEEEP